MQLFLKALTGFGRRKEKEGLRDLEMLVKLGFGDTEKEGDGEVAAILGDYWLAGWLCSIMLFTRPSHCNNVPHIIKIAVLG